MVKSVKKYERKWLPKTKRLLKEKLSENGEVLLLANDLYNSSLDSPPYAVCVELVRKTIRRIK